MWDYKIVRPETLIKSIANHVHKFTSIQNFLMRPLIKNAQNKEIMNYWQKWKAQS